MQNYFENSDITWDILDNTANTAITDYIVKKLGFSIRLLEKNCESREKGVIAKYTIGDTPLILNILYVDSGVDGFSSNIVYELEDIDFNSDEEFIEAFYEECEYSIECSDLLCNIMLSLQHGVNGHCNYDEFTKILKAFNYNEYQIDERYYNRNDFIKYCILKDKFITNVSDDLLKELL